MPGRFKKLLPGEAVEHFLIVMWHITRIEGVNRVTLGEALMDRLASEERKQVMDMYCRGCGDKRPNCPCMRDE